MPSKLAFDKHPRAERVANLLRDCATLYLTKNADYGDAYIKMQQVMQILVPNASLKSSTQVLAYQLITIMVGKVCRVCNLIFEAKEPNHEGAVDSLTDLSVYAAMLAGELIGGVV